MTFVILCIFLLSKGREVLFSWGVEEEISSIIRHFMGYERKPALNA